MTAPVAGLIPCSVGGAMSADDLDVLVDRLCHPHAPKPATDALYRAQVALLYLAALMRRTANRAPVYDELLAALKIVNAEITALPRSALSAHAMKAVGAALSHAEQVKP